MSRLAPIPATRSSSHMLKMTRIPILALARTVGTFASTSSPPSGLLNMRSSPVSVHCSYTEVSACHVGDHIGAQRGAGGHDEARHLQVVVRGFCLVGIRYDEKTALHLGSAGWTRYVIHKLKCGPEPKLKVQTVPTLSPILRLSLRGHSVLSAWHDSGPPSSVRSFRSGGRHARTSMFLRSGVQSSGLLYRRRLQLPSANGKIIVIQYSCIVPTSTGRGQSSHSSSTVLVDPELRKFELRHIANI